MLDKDQVVPANNWREQYAHDQLVNTCKAVIRLSHSTTWGSTFWTIDKRQLTEAAEWLAHQYELIEQEKNGL